MSGVRFQVSERTATEPLFVSGAELSPLRQRIRGRSRGGLAGLHSATFLIRVTERFRTVSGKRERLNYEPTKIRKTANDGNSGSGIAAPPGGGTGAGS